MLRPLFALDDPARSPEKTSFPHAPQYLAFLAAFVDEPKSGPGGMDEHTQFHAKAQSTQGSQSPAGHPSTPPHAGVSRQFPSLDKEGLGVVDFRAGHLFSLTYPRRSLKFRCADPAPAEVGNQVAFIPSCLPLDAATELRQHHAFHSGHLFS